MIEFSQNPLLLNYKALLRTDLISISPLPIHKDLQLKPLNISHLTFSNKIGSTLIIFDTGLLLTPSPLFFALKSTCDHLCTPHWLLSAGAHHHAGLGGLDQPAPLKAVLLLPSGCTGKPNVTAVPTQRHCGFHNMLNDFHGDSSHFFVCHCRLINIWSNHNFLSAA